MAAGLGPRLRPADRALCEAGAPDRRPAGDRRPPPRARRRWLIGRATVVTGHLAEQVERSSATAAPSGSTSASRDSRAPTAPPTPCARRAPRRRSCSPRRHALLAGRRRPLRRAFAARGRGRDRRAAPRRPAAAPDRGRARRARARREARVALVGAAVGASARRCARSSTPFPASRLSSSRCVPAGDRRGRACRGLQIGATRDLTAPVDVLRRTSRT